MARELLLIGCLVAACGRDEPARPAAPARTSPAAPALAAQPFYRIDAGAAPPCASGTTCEARLVLTALGGYHVNQEYPFKLIADPASPLEGEARFAIDDATHGTMTLRFRPQAAGTTRLAGTFKLSVCSDENCEIESPHIELAVPVR